MENQAARCLICGIADAWEPNDYCEGCIGALDRADKQSQAVGARQMVRDIYGGSGALDVHGSFRVEMAGGGPIGNFRTQEGAREAACVLSQMYPRRLFVVEDRLGSMVVSRWRDGYGERAVETVERWS